MDELRIDFPTAPFESVGKLLVRASAVFFGTLPQVAAVTLLIFLPAKAVLQVVSAACDVSEGGVLAYALSGLSDLLLGSLAAPAVVYLLVGKLRTGKASPLGESLRWGWSLWGKSLWNEIKMQVTVMLWALLIIVPGVVAAVRLAFTDVVVGVEGKTTRDVLNRSRELAKGRGWKIFFVLLVLGVMDLAIWGGVLRLHLGPALTDSVMAVVSQWNLVATLLMYLGIRRGEG